MNETHFTLSYNFGAADRCKGFEHLLFLVLIFLLKEPVKTNVLDQPRGLFVGIYLFVGTNY